MEKIVLDASVFLKLIIEEEDSHLAHTLIEKIEEREMIVLVPTLFKYEVSKAGIIFGLEPKFISNILEDFLNTGVVQADITASLLETTKNIVNHGSPKSGFPSFYDAIYHALAIEKNAIFITADKKYFEKAKSFGFIKLLSSAL